jgi:hypothetical protein
MLERKVVKHLKKRVFELGGECRKQRWPGIKGAPDQLVLFSGAPAHVPPHFRHLMVETKRLAKARQAHQVRRRVELTNAGVFVFILDTIDAVDELLGPNGIYSFILNQSRSDDDYEADTMAARGLAFSAATLSSGGARMPTAEILAGAWDQEPAVAWRFEALRHARALQANKDLTK